MAPGGSEEAPPSENSGAGVGNGGGEPGWPDASAEAVFLADARARGEAPVPAEAPPEAKEETDSRSLPKLEELVPRIPPAVRESLEDLFRAQFVRVVRVSRSALKR